MKRLATLTAAVVLAMTAIAFGSAAAQAPGDAPARPEEQRIGPAISIGGLSVAGMTAAEVRTALEPLQKRYTAWPVRVECAGESAQTTFGALGGRLDYARAAAEALRRSDRPRGILDRVRGLFRGPKPIDLPVPFAFRNPPMPASLEALQAQIGKPATNASLRSEGDALILTPGKAGRGFSLRTVRLSAARRLQAENVQAQVAAGLAEPLADWAADLTPIVVSPPLVDVPPRLTAEMLRSIDTQLSAYSTNLGSSSRNRTSNIALAAKAINGTILLPGETLSYNQIVGPRRASRGYRLAGVIVGGKLVPGIGGGICQVSGTLYNAALLADLKIRERRRHGFPVHYLPSGRDATVVYGAQDFRCRNSLPHPILIEMSVRKRRLYATIWGAAADQREVALLRSGIRAIAAGNRVVMDPALPVGKKVVAAKPRTGWRVTLIRVVKNGDQVVRREVISRDYYPPRAGLVRIGIAKPPTEENGDPPSESSAKPPANSEDADPSRG